MHLFGHFGLHYFTYLGPAGDSARGVRYAMYECDHLIPQSSDHLAGECPKKHRRRQNYVEAWDGMKCGGCSRLLLYEVGSRMPTRFCSGSAKGTHRPEARFHVVTCTKCRADLLYRPPTLLSAPCRGDRRHSPSAVSAREVKNL